MSVNTMMTGKEAVLAAAGNFTVKDYPEGMLVCPPGLSRVAGRYGKVCAPVFYPSDQGEAYRMTRSALRYAVTYSTAVLIRLENSVAVLRGRVQTDSKAFGSGRAMEADSMFAVSGRTMEADGQRNSAALSAYPESEHNSAMLSQALSDSLWNRPAGNGRTGVISMGPLWNELQKLLDGKEGLRKMKVGTPEPFPEKAVLFFLKDLREVITVSPPDFDLAGNLYGIRDRYRLSFSIKKARIPGKGMRAIEERKRDISA